MRARFPVTVALSAIVLASTLTGSVGGWPGIARAGRTVTVPTTAECGADPAVVPIAGGLATFSHVVLVVEENKPYGAVIGSRNAPYLDQLAADCGQVTNYHGIQYPSLPNYIALTSGAIPGFIAQGTTYANGAVKGRDCSWSPTLYAKNCHSGPPDLYDELGTAAWSELSEGQTVPCQAGNSGSYVQRHNPATYYTDLVSSPNTACTTNDLPLSTPYAPPTAALTVVIPDLLDDGHTGSSTAAEVQATDTWLQGYLPTVIDSPDYQADETVVIITWDSDTHAPSSTSTGGPNVVPFLVLSKDTPAGAVYAGPTPGYCGATPWDCTSTYPNHYTALRLIQDLLESGPVYLGHAGDAGQPDLRPSFGLCDPGTPDACPPAPAPPPARSG